MSDEASLRSILDDLIDLFGWEDKTPLHAVLHVRNAVNNLRADLAVAYLAGAYLAGWERGPDGYARRVTP